MSSLLLFLFSLPVPKGMEATLLSPREESNPNKYKSKGNEVKIDREEAEMEGWGISVGFAEATSSGPFPFFFCHKCMRVPVYMSFESAL